MNKSVGIAAGVIVVVGALATAGAWYTGTRIEGVLRDSIEQGNQELVKSLKGSGSAITLEMLSIDRHLFSSTAHYRVRIHDENLTTEDKNAEFLFVDNIEHGPLPFSRLKSFKLLPVMAQSNFEMEQSPSAAKWFAMSKGVSPVTGHASIGYDRSTSGALLLTPLELKDTDGTFTFSGLRLDTEASADAEKIKVLGKMDNFQLNVTSPEGDVALGAKGLTLDMGGTKGKSGFYLGHNTVKVDNLVGQIAGLAPVAVKDLTGTSLIQEEGGTLAGQASYNLGMISYDGKDVGALQSAFKFSNFDVAASKAMYDLYQTKIMPQQQAAYAAGELFVPQLSPADQQLMDAQIIKLLAAKPHVELEKLALKTANGESHLRVAVDLTDTGTEQPSPERYRNAIAQMEARLVLSKPMIGDLAALQANLAGQTDPAAIAEQAKAAGDMVGAMAVMMQMAKVDGDNIVSNMQYANNIVDFNGQKMPPAQFMALIMSKVMGMEMAQPPTE
ncbi:MULTISPECIES: YdgA family protein [Pseudomonas syringae group]|uniref:YdgA family protein n=1 Tax=Pseudomonas syringae group TaxID=136849 RepID=UPI001E50C2CD|nr:MULTISPECIES: YdgA family protein [Pseudomonas]MCD5987728.1 YdgA family protein [Pseudomonas quasicaspiana]MCQ2998018.1 YdgA family protein [Pseudomonas syringae]MCQ3034484.1 YdgA family protein [Pseudomonas syringae]MDU8362299.1 YdgA family protein [Pseudomonas syringae group sp. J309-1]